MSKYIIEIPDGTPYVLLRREEFGIIKAVPVSELEELTIDYIKENCKSLLNELYQKGYKDGRNVGIKDGMCESWEAARKITSSKEEGALSSCELKEIFGTYFVSDIIRGCTAQEVIDKIKSYEDGKKADSIEVGDEVNWNGDCFVVTRIYQPLVDKRCNGIAKDGSVYMDVVCDRLTKTGRHFDIASILEAMRK